jgi:hypothetical protein
MKWLGVLFHIGVVMAIILFAISPMIPVAIAGTIASANGCTLHEGFVNPCVINGVDRGETLYAMGMAGWFFLATLPLGLIALAVYVVGVLLFYVGRFIIRRRREIRPDGAV